MGGPVILLDFDGTLTDSRPGIVASHHAALRAMGHVPDLDMDLTQFIGPPIAVVMADVLRLYEREATPARVTQAVAAYRAHYGTEGLFGSVLYDGVREALAALAQGARLFLATSKRVDFARRMLERFGLLDRFAGVYGAASEGGLDHKPDLLRHLVRAEGLDPSQCVMVGDREHDVLAARTNGIAPVGVLWGYGSREELMAAGAARLVRSPGALARLLSGPVRAATQADLPAVLGLHGALQSGDPAWDPVAAEVAWERMAASGVVTVLVAEAAGQVAATCTLAIVPNLTWAGRPWAVIENVATAPSHRGRGLGRRVLAEAEARAWAAGCYKVSLATGSAQAETLRFYEGAGFVRNAKTYFEIRLP